MKQLFFLLSLLLLPTACRQTPVAYEYQPTPADGWEPTDTLCFQTDTLTEEGTYQLHVGLRTATVRPYPYQSLWLVVHQDWPSLPYRQTDTVECRLANGQGERTGNGVTRYQYEIPVTQVTAPSGSRAHIRIHHIMRNDMLTGIAEVGIKLERTMP